MRFQDRHPAFSFGGMRSVASQFPGSAPVSDVGFGVSPKQSLKVRDREDAIASTRDACATQMLMQTLRMIIEMRTYKIRPGLRAEFLKTFESKVRPEHEKIGMNILGPFLSIEDTDTFFWMRAFPDLKSRERM
jgi:hypothetical protein